MRPPSTPDHHPFSQPASNKDSNITPSVAIMANSLNPQAFKDCYASFQKADSDRNVLITQLLEDFDVLYRENLRMAERLENESIKMAEQLENERETRIMWQNHARTYKNELNRLKLDNESHPFVAMIIDGDGAKFRDDFLRLGDDGGSYAARELEQQIKNGLQAKYPNSNVNNWNILVYFYANMDGLGRALTARRILPSSSELQKFGSGFGRANSLFSFIDVGYGKDKADHKCREMLKVMLHISNCQDVIFGPCNDNGYLTLLDEYKHDPVMKKKLTLFAAEPPERGFVDLGFDIVRFPTVFRSEPLSNLRLCQTLSSDSIGQTPLSSQRPLLRMPTSISDEDLSDTTASLSLASEAPSPPPALRAVSAPTPAPAPTTAPAPAPAPSPAPANPSTPTPTSTWAVVSKISNGPIIDLYSKKAPIAKLKYILINAANQRVDEKLPPPDAIAMKSVDNRARDQGCNFCNSYHLLGSCDRGHLCGYQHEVSRPFTPAEKLALRHKSRQIVCSEGQWCASFKCLNGHHCKNIYNGQICPWGSKCFFKDGHNLDVVRTLDTAANHCAQLVLLQ
ncbi:hypothetical protein BD289DRAFT_59641 [Coniella lustricola]|uniref:C3H1-type domain-containing protein n=1 Tax=Coniella lustricola TaxID=2025994 RepID=A0A2T3A0S8_9PEZI|nr:hypothetical protein BD289DRAFT_59641 [Coniella lustricola]